MTTTSLAPSVVWAPPTAVRVRGTIALLAGAGEEPGVYTRFGTRISADGYVVGVFGSGDADAAAAWLADAETAPRVLAGSDRGAAAALAVAAEDGAGTAGIDGLLLAGLPVAGVDDATADAAARTACPVHLGVLGAAPRVPAEAAASAPLPVPSAAALRALRVPVLAVHGGADELAPFAAAREVLGAVPTLELVETVGGLHDALNDQSHRSVAATIVLWLERLRTGDVGSALVREAIR